MAIALGLCVLAFAYCDQYWPHEDAAKNMTAYKESLQTQADLQRAADKRVQKAMDMVNQAAQKWQVYVGTRTPPENLPYGINVDENPYQLVNDSQKYRNSAQRALNAQLRVGGVKIVSDAPSIPDPGWSEKDILASYYNFPAFSFPVV
ncbi:MAG TPA: hypothetical protein VMI31_07785, partial [Fimbriimonadaceae bacterium]|nr:hypothetical protein [Fimbriimonadaceae bacterium]